MRLGGDRDGVAFEGVKRGVPAEGGALDARGEGVDPGKGGDVADVIGRLAGGDDVMEFLEEFFGFARGLPFEPGGHERGAGLRDGAAGAVERNFRDGVGVTRRGGNETEVNAAFVAAGGIVAVGNAVGGGQFAAITGAAVVVENDLLVEFREVGGHGVEGRNRWRSAKLATAPWSGHG